MRLFAVVSALSSLASVSAASGEVGMKPPGTNLTFHGPATISQCQTINVSWSGAPGPYRFAAIPEAASGNWTYETLIDVTNDTSVTWTVNYPAGMFFALFVSTLDVAANGSFVMSPDDYAYKAYTTIGPGDSRCMSGANSTANSTASAATGAFSSASSQGAATSSKKAVSSGATAGITIGVLVAVILLALLAAISWRFKRKRRVADEKAPKPFPHHIFEVDPEPAISPLPYSPTSPTSPTAMYGLANKSTTAVNSYSTDSHTTLLTLGSLGASLGSRHVHVAGPSKHGATLPAEVQRALTLLEAELARPRPDTRRWSMQDVLRQAKLLRESQDVSRLAIQQAAEVLCAEAERAGMPDSHVAKVMAVAFRLSAASEDTAVVRELRLPEPAMLRHAEDGGSVMGAGDDMLPPVYNPNWNRRLSCEH